MAVLDKFIQVMFEQGAGRLPLQSGLAVVLDIDGTEKPVTREALTTAR